VGLAKRERCGVDDGHELVNAMMDERTRQVFERARQVLDRGGQQEREHAEWLEHRRDPVTGHIDLGEDNVQPPTQQQRRTNELVYKTFSTPAPQQHAAPPPPFSPTQFRVLAQAIAMERHAMREHVAAEIKRLRDDLERDDTDKDSRVAGEET
jgi:hypothetical protein